MKPTITNIESSHRMHWEHGEHTGTITFPFDERGLAAIEWDGDLPDDWEEIEEAVEANAVESLTATEGEE